ncbi:hypothetical protein FQN54_005313 [Arachnomyces sp. PD_36]|nr:hypothetical protein FQN54_005313 [Arachnomyces sp. PD_36]
MQLSTIYVTAVSLLFPAVYANPWGTNALKGRDIPQCIDGSGSGCANGPWSDFTACQDQCYGAEADTGEICGGTCEQVPIPNGSPGPILCFCSS